MAKPAYRSERIPILSRRIITALAVVAALPFASPSYALDTPPARILKELDPSARLTTLCNTEAMSRIAHDLRKKGYRPDRAVEAATEAATVEGNSLIGKGAAFRSRGRWYRLSYTCKTNASHMKVLSFSYKVGGMIPRSDWKKYDLWN